MIDAHARRLIDPPLEALARVFVRLGWSANGVTVGGFVVGVLGCVALAFRWDLIALSLILLNRVADGLDGALARRLGPTELGGYLDIVLDFVFYAAFPFAFAVGRPEHALPAAFLILAFVSTGTTFLAFAAVAARLGLSTERRGRKAIYYLGGLTEGTETIALFVLICLKPGWFPALAWGFGGLCGLTAASRIWWAVQAFGRPTRMGADATTSHRSEVPDMSVIRTHDGSIAYHDVGSGPVVVLLHSFPLDHVMWQPQREALARSYRVITPDARGLGGSSPFPSAPTIDALADDVASLLDELKVEGPVVVGGQSMGGYAALAFARKYPNRLRGLILADTKAEPDDAAAREKRDELITRLDGGLSPADLAAEMLPKLLGERTRRDNPAVADLVREIAGGETAAGVANAVRALRDRPDARPHLASIRVPTLVIVGEEDTLTPPANARTLAEGIPGAKLVELPGSGHLSNLEVPAAFTAAVEEWLAALPDQPAGAAR